MKDAHGTKGKKNTRGAYLPAPGAARDAGLKFWVAPGSFEVPGSRSPVVLSCRDFAAR